LSNNGSTVLESPNHGLIKILTSCLVLWEWKYVRNWSCWGLVFLESALPSSASTDPCVAMKPDHQHLAPVDSQCEDVWLVIEVMDTIGTLTIWRWRDTFSRLHQRIWSNVATCLAIQGASEICKWHGQHSVTQHNPWIFRELVHLQMVTLNSVVPLCYTTQSLLSVMNSPSLMTTCGIATHGMQPQPGMISTASDEGITNPHSITVDVAQCSVKLFLGIHAKQRYSKSERWSNPACQCSFDSLSRCSPQRNE
jgi:hypothetical protein